MIELRVLSSSYLNNWDTLAAGHGCFKAKSLSDLGGDSRWKSLVFFCFLPSRFFGVAFSQPHFKLWASVISKLSCFSLKTRLEAFLLMFCTSHTKWLHVNSPFIFSAAANVPGVLIIVALSKCMLNLRVCPAFLGINSENNCKV